MGYDENNEDFKGLARGKKKIDRVPECGGEGVSRSSLDIPRLRPRCYLKVIIDW